MKYLRFLLVPILLFIVIGCENAEVSTKSKDEESEGISLKEEDKSHLETQRVLINVDGELISDFISNSEFYGMQKAKPSPTFFVHLTADGYSIQLEGESPEELTGVMAEISYTSQNFGMAKGNIVGLIGLLLDEEKSDKANQWLNKEIANSEISLRQGNKPTESHLNVGNLVIKFFPPISLDELNATVIISANENVSNGKMEGSSTTVPNVGEDENTSKDKSLSSNIEVNKVDEYGVTQLARASGEGDVQLVIELLSLGADPNLHEGLAEPPLLWAVRSSQDNVVKLLLEADANPNFKTKEGVTPLMVAKEEGANVVIKYLLEYGAEK